MRRKNDDVGWGDRKPCHVASTVLFYCRRYPTEDFAKPCTTVHPYRTEGHPCRLESGYQRAVAQLALSIFPISSSLASHVIW